MSTYELFMGLVAVRVHVVPCVDTSNQLRIVQPIRFWMPVAGMCSQEQEFDLRF